MQHDMSELAGDLQYARRALKRIQDQDPRSIAYAENLERVRLAFQSLDEGGAFSFIDAYLGAVEEKGVIKDRILSGVPSDGGPHDAVGSIRTLRDRDEVDFSGSVHHAPVIGKIVTNNYDS